MTDSKRDPLTAFHPRGYSETDYDFVDGTYGTGWSFYCGKCGEKNLIELKCSPKAGETQLGTRRTAVDGEWAVLLFLHCCRDPTRSCETCELPARIEGAVACVLKARRPIVEVAGTPAPPPRMRKTCTKCRAENIIESWDNRRHEIPLPCRHKIARVGDGEVEMLPYCCHVPMHDCDKCSRATEYQVAVESVLKSIIPKEK